MTDVAAMNREPRVKQARERVIAVSRILNEADVIEPFVRHHAALVDLHIVLDNGSTDGTVEILRALHLEGLKLQVYQSVTSIFFEQTDNTALYKLAVNEGADWVLFLDADELFVASGDDDPREYLASLSREIICVRMPSFRYAPPVETAGSHPFSQLRARHPNPEMYKIAARAVERSRLLVSAGNHHVWIDGNPDWGFEQGKLWLAHVPERAPLQSAIKAILSRLKPTATGAKCAARFGIYWLDDYEALKNDARGWLNAWRDRTSGGNTEQIPIRYRGGVLRYTVEPDALARMISIFATQSELLARSHGGIVERNAAIGHELTKQASSVSRLF